MLWHMDLSFHGLVTFIVASALVDIYIYICEDVNSTDVRTVDISCKAYNFRFFKTSCGKNIPNISLSI